MPNALRIQALTRKESLWFFSCSFNCRKHCLNFGALQPCDGSTRFLTCIKGYIFKGLSISIWGFIKRDQNLCFIALWSLKVCLVLKEGKFRCICVFSTTFLTCKSFHRYCKEEQLLLDGWLQCGLWCQCLPLPFHTLCKYQPFYFDLGSSFGSFPSLT